MKSKSDLIFEFIQKETYITQKYRQGIDTQTIATALKMQRANVSTILNSLVKENRLTKTKSRPVKYLPVQNIKQTSYSQFDHLINSSESLASAIHTAKAAVLYPSSSRRIMLISQSGCGKTEFVSSLFQFSKEKHAVSEDGKLIVVNCSNYKTCPEKAGTFLFGPNSDPTKSAFFIAQKGMLFIEHAEFLLPEDECRLMDLLDNGCLYTSDYQHSIECSNLILVISYDHFSKQTALQKHFISIELPRYIDRSIKERFELICYIFNKEFSILNRTIQITREAMEGLILTDFENNIQGLVQEIKNSCAKAYLRVADKPTKDVRIFLDDLDINTESLYNDPPAFQELNSTLGVSNVFFFNNHGNTSLSETPIVSTDSKTDMEDLQAESTNTRTKNIILLYVFYGEHIASALRDETNYITQGNYSYSCNLSHGMTDDQIYGCLLDTIQKIDNVNGIIVLYDSNFLEKILDNLIKNTGINLRYIYMPLSSFGISLAQQCMTETNIDYITHNAQLQLNRIFYPKERKKNLIITFEKSANDAIMLKRYIDQYSKLNIEVQALFSIHRQELLSKVIDLKKAFHIHCIIGPQDPQLIGIPFISSKMLLENDVHAIDQILMFEPANFPFSKYEALYAEIELQLKYTSISRIKSVIPPILNTLFDIYTLGAPEKMTVFRYLMLLPENILAGNRPHSVNKNQIFSIYKDDYSLLRKLLTPMEKAFKIIISDQEFAELITLLHT